MTMCMFYSNVNRELYQISVIKRKNSGMSRALTEMLRHNSSPNMFYHSSEPKADEICFSIITQNIRLILTSVIAQGSAMTFRGKTLDGEVLCWGPTH